MKIIKTEKIKLTEKEYRICTQFYDIIEEVYHYSTMVEINKVCANLQENWEELLSFLTEDVEVEE